MPYNHKAIETKWQKYWSDHQTFAASNQSEKPKKYILDMFPYPSGTGLHVGHPKGYTATDIISRYYHANGYNVLHPMGFDAFGLPAENYAIKTGTHPAITTAKNIETFITQLQALGFSYDWNRTINTTDPSYYKWTQWIFLELFRRGLAYEQDLPINYCPSCKTGLANEEVLSDNTCERCGTLVERRPIRQWVLKITEYADRLIDDLDTLDWPESVKEMQRNWIGRSEGCEFEMYKSDDPTKFISVYTTRVDTVYGMTYAVMAPDHPRVYDFIMDEQSQDCESYITEALSRSDQDRTADTKSKTGVFTGSYVINPYNGESVPLWISDFVLGHYGTGALMAVPAHDERDFEFAKKYNLPIRQSIRQHWVYQDDKKAREGVETLNRRVIDVIIENEKGEFLVLKEENPTQIHFVGGGIEEGDSELETVRKEILEETGYTDIEIVGPIEGTYKGSLGFRFPKGKNQNAWGRFFHVKIKSENRIPSEVEEGRHSIHWYKKEEIAQLLNWEPHAYAWNIFRNGIQPTGDDGITIELNIPSAEARHVLTEKAEKEGFGRRMVNYKLRDWLFSRQRYWGEPIPLIHINNQDYVSLPRVQGADAWIREDGNDAYLMIGTREFSKVYPGLNSQIVIDSDLPLTLPEVEKYEPAGDGQSPLATVPEWVNIKLAENLVGQRETNTMPQWGGSCWYYLRYMDNTNNDALASRDALDYWGIVDEYVGGAEHAVLHLLYARFWHKVLYDAGIVPVNEPFYKLTNVGMVLAYAYERPGGGLVAVDLVEERDGRYFLIETGEEVKRIIAKMSKSLKNTANPMDIVAEYGADTLRLYEMSIGDFRDTAPWNPEAIIGVRRFLDKVYATYTEGKNLAKDDMKAMKLLHKTIKKIGEDIIAYKFNTAVSALIILLNEGIPTDGEFAQEWREKFLLILHPFAPHMAEELWMTMGNQDSIYTASWPNYDEFMLVDDEVTIAVQVNGKLRGTLTCFNGVAQEEVSLLARDTPDIAKWLEGKTLVKEIFIPNKMLSIVVKD